MKRLLLVLASLVALSGSFVAGHYFWPETKNAKADKRRANRYGACPPVNQEAANAGALGQPPAPPPPMQPEELRSLVTRSLANPNDSELYGQVMIALESVDPDQLKSLIELALSKPGDNQVLSGVMIQRWTEADPQAAAAFALALHGPRQREMLDRVVMAWADEDPVSAKTFIDKLSDKQLRGQLVMNIIASFAHESPREALALAQSVLPGQVANAMSSVFSVWADDDPKAALDAASKLPASTTKQEVLGSALSGWARLEPEAALDWLTRESRDIGYYDYQAFSAVSMEHPEIAARYAERLGTSRERTEIFSNIARQWFDSDSKAAMSWIKKLDDQDRRAALGGAIDQQSMSDPQAAIELTKLIDNPGYRNEQLVQTYARWAREDPAGAFASVETMRDGTERDAALTQVVSGWASLDPAHAATLVTQVKGESNRGEAINTVAMSWSMLDPAAASAWVQTLPNDETRVNAFRGIVTNWTQSDPKAAMQFAERSGDASIVSAAASSWATSDPIAAADWASDQSLGEDDYVVNTIASSWFSRDERGATDWAMGLRDNKQRDQALATLAGVMGYRDQAGAIDVALSMSEGTTRNNTLRDLYATWQRQDSGAAQRWLASSGLNESTRKTLTTDAPLDTGDEPSNGCVCP